MRGMVRQRGTARAKNLLVLVATIAVIVSALVATASPLPASDLPIPGTAASLDAENLVWSNANSPAGGLGWSIGGSGSLLIASTIGDGVLQSTDNGASWDPIPGFPIEEPQAIVADPTDPDVVYVGGFGGLARTTDGGATWDHIRSDSRTTVVAVSPTGQLAVSARVSVSWADTHILVSDDRGATWNDANAPIGTTSLYGLTYGATNDILVVGSISNTWSTTDGGATWTTQNPGVQSLTADAAGVIWRAGWGGFDKSTDGGLTWSAVGGSASQLAPRPGGGIFAAGFGGIRSTTDGGATWTDMGQGDMMWALTGLFADPLTADAVFLSHEGLGVLWVGPDGNGGYTLEGRTNGFPPAVLYSLGASGDGSVLLAGGPLGLFASRDGGASWAHTGAGFGYQGVRATTANTDGSILYAGGSSMIFAPFLLYSQDGGSSWDYADVQIGGDGRVVSIVAHPEEPMTAYAVIWGELTASQVRKTTDGGVTWDSVLVSDVRLNSGAWDPSQDRLLVASDAGVLAYDDTVGAWLPVLVSGSPVRALTASTTQAYAGGASTMLWGSQGTPVFAPYATLSAPVAGLAAEPAGDAVYAALTNGELRACSGPLLAASCTDETPPGGTLQALLVTPDGGAILVATLEDGLWRAELGGS